MNYKLSYLIRVLSVVLLLGIWSGRVDATEHISTVVYFPLTGVPGFVTGGQIANMAATAAVVTVTVYEDGVPVGSPLNDTIPGNGSKTYFPINNIGGRSGTTVQVSSSQKIVGIGNILRSDFRTGASYDSPQVAATTLQLPLLFRFHSGYSSVIGIQNAGSSPATVNATYSDGTIATATIPVNSAYLFDQESETHTATVFSAVVSSDVSIVAAVLIKNEKVLSAYTGFTNGSINPVFPLINANNSGYVTGIQIQNIGTSDTTLTLSYTPSSVGTACTETKTVAAGASETFALNAFNDGSSSTCIPLAKFVGSARVTANSAAQPLVGIANQLLSGINGEAYGSFDPEAATNTVVMPLIMDRNGGYYTGFNVLNVGAISAVVNCTFTNSAYTVSKTIDPGAAMTDAQSGKIADKYVGAATCSATSASAKLVAVVNELGSLTTADQLLVYEAFAK